MIKYLTSNYSTRLPNNYRVLRLYVKKREGAGQQEGFLMVERKHKPGSFCFSGD